MLTSISHHESVNNKDTSVNIISVTEDLPNLGHLLTVTFSGEWILLLRG